MYIYIPIVYMDDDESCEISVRNDDLAEGDRYLVKSDSWQGHAPWARRPAECTVTINYGDRLVAMNIVEWWCDKMFKDPFLAVYDSCLSDRSNLLVGTQIYAPLLAYRMWYM